MTFCVPLFIVVIIELRGVDEMKYKVMTQSIKLPLEAPLDTVTLCYELFEAILNLCSSGCQAAVRHLKS